MPARDDRAVRGRDAAWDSLTAGAAIIRAGREFVAAMRGSPSSKEDMAGSIENVAVKYRSFFRSKAQHTPISLFFSAAIKSSYAMLAQRQRGITRPSEDLQTRTGGVANGQEDAAERRTIDRG